MLGFRFIALALHRLRVLALTLVGESARAAGAADAGAADASSERADASGAGVEPAAPVEHSDPARTVRVAVTGSVPFVATNGDEITGLSVDIWREAAARANLSYELVAYPNVTAALDAVSAGKVDAAVGPISITAERAERVRFTQPYFQSNLAILSSASSSAWNRIEPLLSRAFAAAVGILLVVLLLVGTLLWLAERKHNTEQFPMKPVRGIANGVWLALVTMTTVGYGDRVPKTTAGRVIAGVWMVIALLTTTSLTAGIASAITLTQLAPSEIETADDLRGRKVATVRGTTSTSFARGYGARVTPKEDLNAAIASLEAGDVDAVIFDRPMLHYYLSEHPESELRIAPASYEPQGYGFATSSDGELEQRLSVALLELHEAKRVSALSQRWLGCAPPCD